MRRPRSQNYSSRPARFFGIVAALAVACGVVFQGAAAESETNRFVVLELKVTAAEVTVIGATEVAGKPKAQPAKAGVDYELRSVDNALLHSGQVADPRLQHFCYENPPGSGQMTNHTALLDEGYVTVRVPSDSSAGSIEFFESRRPGVSLLSPRRSLGKTALVRK